MEFHRIDSRDGEEWVVVRNEDGATIWRDGVLPHAAVQEVPSRRLPLRRERDVVVHQLQSILSVSFGRKVRTKIYDGQLKFRYHCFTSY
jgi:hypothetical protein